MVTSPHLIYFLFIQALNSVNLIQLVAYDKILILKLTIYNPNSLKKIKKKDWSCKFKYKL